MSFDGQIVELSRSIGELDAKVEILLDASVRNEQRLEKVQVRTRETAEKLEQHEEFLKKVRNRAIAAAGAISAAVGWIISSWDAIISFVSR